MKHFASILLLIIVFEVTAQKQMLIPPTLSGEDVELVLQPGTYEFFDGISTATLGANGDVLGPTIVLDKNQDVNITVENKIGETTTIHWHGMHVSAANDGGPHTTIKAGEIWNPRFTVLDNAATYWYHPHLHMKTNDHVLQGLAGLIIVRDEAEAALDLPRDYGVDDIPVVIQTKAFDSNKQIVLGKSALDTEVLANATRRAFYEVPAQVVRLRLLNGSSERLYNIGFTGNMPFYQIASDGGLLQSPVQLTRLWLSPGERAEILIDLSDQEGQNINLKSYASELPTGYYGAAQVGMNAMMTIPNYNSNPLNGSDFNILELRVAEPLATGVRSILRSLVNDTPYNVNDVDRTRSIDFMAQSMGPTFAVNGPFVFDGRSFDLDYINQTIPLNNTEIWTLTNHSMIAHPFHIHDVQFYILSRNGAPVAQNERGRKDVVIVPPRGGTVTFITKFEDFADDEIPYMYHCHMLTHEDEGMMGQFLVVGTTTAVNDDLVESVRIYPNPSSGMVQLRGVAQNIVKLYSTNGQLLELRRPTGEVEVFDLSTYAEGMYYFEVTNAQYSRTYKLVKN